MNVRCLKAVCCYTGLWIVALSTGITGAHPAIDDYLRGRMTLQSTALESPPQGITENTNNNSYNRKKQERAPALGIASNAPSVSLVQQ
jgi:hypothetical protein